MWIERINEELSSLKQASRLRELGTEEGVSFSHNDYLGLSRHPDICEAGSKALRNMGSGAKGSRLLGGHSGAIEEAEAEIAAFFGAPDALIFPSGYQANIGVFQAMGALADAVVSDASNHASMIDGIRLTSMGREIVPHHGWRDWCPSPDKRYLLAAESLYSMDGDFVDPLALCEAWEKCQGFLILDEAHAVGVFGRDGRGFFVPWRNWDRMCVTVTFGKAFGVGAGAVLCRTEVKNWLVNSARTFIYTTAPAPVVPAMIRSSLSVMQTEGLQLREELWQRAREVRDVWRQEGLPVGPSVGEWGDLSPIVPLFIPGNDRALRFSQIMRNSGWDLRAIRYPTVPQGLERIRVSLNLLASREETNAMTREVVKRWKAFL